MVDIETLGTAPGSVVLSVGAVDFSDRGLGAEFYRVIDVFDSLRHGLRVEPETVAWWRTQSEEAMAPLYERGARRRLDEALQDFSRYLDGPPVCVWAKGPDFDLVLLQAAYAAVGRGIPWKYWYARDVRTVLALREVEVVPELGSVRHSALSDARYQAAQVLAVYQALGLALT